MIGWIILFALLTLQGAVPSVWGSVAAEASMRAGGALFGFLLITCLLTRLVRGSA